MCTWIFISETEFIVRFSGRFSFTHTHTNTKESMKYTTITLNKYNLFCSSSTFCWIHSLWPFVGRWTRNHNYILMHTHIDGDVSRVTWPRSILMPQRNALVEQVASDKNNWLTIDCPWPLVKLAIGFSSIVFRKLWYGSNREGDDETACIKSSVECRRP